MYEIEDIGFQEAAPYPPLHYAAAVPTHPRMQRQNGTNYHPNLTR
jgi:hypothetical protein